MKGRLPAFGQGLTKYHATVHDLFAAYGSFVAAHPIPPLIVGVLILGSLCIGTVRIKEEIDIENLWVERNSRIIPEKQFFDSRFGGIPREQTAAITMKTYPDEKLNDLRLAMDAFTSVVKPLYDDLSFRYTKDGHVEVELKQADFCERPLVPKTLRSGADPNKHGNWYAWGYRSVSTCVLNTIKTLYPINVAEYKLPDDWGLDVLPCNKLSPMDCFQEGKNIDYPEALQQLEKLVILNVTLNATLNQAVAGFERFTNNLCSNQLESALKSDPKSVGVTTRLSSEQITNIMAGLRTVINIFAGWGYNWRRSYKSMSNEEILDYFNKAIEFSKNTSINWRNPAVLHCLTENRPCCLTWFGASVPVETSFGGLEYDQFGNISAIASFRWGGDHWNHKHPLWIEYISNRLNMSLTDEQRKNLVLSWENLMIGHLSPLHANAMDTNFTSGATFEDYQIQFTIWRSTEDLLRDANSVPVWQIILSVILVFSYAFFSFVNVHDPVHSHTCLVLMGMIIVSFAIVAGFGLTSSFGIKLSPLAGSVVPFLTLGLGIDDVFVLVNMLRNYLASQPTDSARLPEPENEMRLTISHAGPSVVLTTFSVLASFFISSVTPMPIVRWFCWQMGITAVIHTCGMLLIFIPLMSLDARRVKLGIVDPSLWLFYRRRQPKEATNNSEVDVGNCQEYRASSPISLAIAKYYAPLFQYNIFKIIVMLFFTALLSISIYFTFWKVEHGLRLSDIALKGSYQHDYARLVEDIYPQYNLFLVTQNIEDYSTAQNELLEVYNRPESNLSVFLLSSAKILDYTWMANLYSTVNLTWGLSYPIPAQNFSQLTQSWSSSPLGVFSLQDLYCESSFTKQQKSCFSEEGSTDWKIGATKTVILATSVGSDTHNNIEMIKQTRRALDNLNQVYFNGTKVVYMYGYPYLFNEQYLHSIHDLYMVVGFALVGVFVAVFIFQFSLVVSLVIVILLLMVDIEVYGFLYVLGAKLNALSLVNLGIVIGMASEFTYLARSFLLFDGTKNERVQKALEWTFEPLLHGLGTQVVATLPLLFLKYHAFRVYYFGMFTIMGALAFLNGFVLLPTVLSWIGPPTITHTAKDVNRSSLGTPELSLTHNAIYGDAHNSKESQK